MLEALNRFARLASARSEVVGASLIILMIVMMVIPLNPAVIDVLLAVNISICILLVISAVLIETPLAFSSFPAILLITTLFRLALTISTTRLILLEADAGLRRIPQHQRAGDEDGGVGADEDAGEDGEREVAEGGTTHEEEEEDGDQGADGG